ncbi:MAG: hypothetical protein HQK84_05105 [Nitrospinae bacterium]|nr:hypothetical protein [Nitrospinota bacterium]
MKKILYSFLLIFFSSTCTSYAYCLWPDYPTDRVCLWGNNCTTGNCTTGYGTFEWSNNNKYKGEWLNGKRHGKGVFTDGSGFEYNGEWENDKKHGKGVEKQLPEFYVYEGDFKDGMRSGKGTAFYGNKSNKYTGDWENNKRHGTGTMVWINDEGKIDRYEGEWKNDQRDGNGMRQYENGITYIGGWKNNLESGKGTLHFIDGSTYEGVWEEGKLQRKYDNIRSLIAIEKEEREAMKENDFMESEYEDDLQTTNTLLSENEITLDSYKYYNKYCPNDFNKKVTCTKSGDLFSCTSEDELGEGLNLREALIQSCF